MKKLYLIFLSICLFSFTSIVNADTCVRDATNNYGVNKKWNMTSNRIKHANSTPCVDASEKIYDFSNLLSDEEKKSLKQKMQEFELLTNMDIVFVSTDFYYSSDSKNEDYAADFYDYNDFGLKYDHYSGVLLLRNTYSENPYFNIYTFGSAQLYFSYNRLENILDRIYPYFKNDVSYYNGINIFIDDLTDYYNSGISEKYENATLDDMGKIVLPYKVPVFWSIIVAIIGTAIIVPIEIGKNKMVKKSKYATDYLDKDSINYKVKEDRFIRSHTSSYKVSSSSGGGSSIGSSGGGHSSGGGRHG